MGAAGFALASSLPDFPEKAGWGMDKTSRVVIVTDEGASSGSSIEGDVVQVMMDRGIMELTDETTVGAAWFSLFPGITPSSRIGIKVNCINRYCSSHPKVALTIAEGLAQMEVGKSNFPRNNIIIWDRTNGELTNAGYTRYIGSDPDTVRCLGTNQSGFGYDYDAPLAVQGKTCYPSSILAQHCDYLINLSVMKNHTMSGVTFSLKNHFGSIHNPSALHGSSSTHCDPYVPELNQQIRDQLGGPQVLSICDAIFGISSGGPHGYPQFTYNGLLLSQDPVALDYQGMQILKDHDCMTTSIATHIATAASPPYNLGTNDPLQMDVRYITNPVTAVLEDEKPDPLPSQYHVGSAYPNPFNARSVIPYHIGGQEAVPVQIEVFNIRGQRVRTLFHDDREPGDYRVVWDGRDQHGDSVASGLYLCRLKAGGHEAKAKMSLVR
jgi:uncharacterized protein (DUF362 family)